MNVDTVLGLGFYEAIRLWEISDELRARDLAFMSRAIDLPHTKDENRNEFNEWLLSRQPRRAPRKNLIPPDILEAFKLKWDEVNG